MPSKCHAERLCRTSSIENHGQTSNCPWCLHDIAFATWQVTPPGVAKGTDGSSLLVFNGTCTHGTGRDALPNPCLDTLAALRGHPPATQVGVHHRQLLPLRLGPQRERMTAACWCAMGLAHSEQDGNRCQTPALVPRPHRCPARLSACILSELCSPAAIAIELVLLGACEAWLWATLATKILQRCAGETWRSMEPLDSGACPGTPLPPAVIPAQLATI